MRYVDSIPGGVLAANGGCYLCGRRAGGLVDMETTIVGEGYLYVCKTHVEQMKRAVTKGFKYFTPEEAMRFKADNDRLNADLTAAIARAQELEKAVELVASAHGAGAHVHQMREDAVQRDQKIQDLTAQLERLTAEHVVQTGELENARQELGAATGMLGQLEKLGLLAPDAVPA